MRNILVVGAGGIGSWLAWQLHHLNQFNQLTECLITFADDDTVDSKNLPYQYFDQLDLTDNKAEVIGIKYQFEYLSKRIKTKDQLANYDLIVSAVDNAKFRKLLFEYVNENPDVYWIDLRSEGRAIAFYTKHKNNSIEKMLGTLPDDLETEGSCQLAFELDNGIVQVGNRIIATFGAQLILNWYRSEPNPPSLNTYV